MSKFVKGRWLWGALAFLTFLGLAVASTWPLCQSPISRLPMGAEQARTVPYLNLWTLEWNVRCLSSGVFLRSGYWDAPIFWPERDALAMSECQPILAICAPIYWMTGSSVLSYNLYLLLSLTLNGYVTWCLLQTRGYGSLPSLGGGVAMLLLPIVHWQLGVLQLVPIWAIVWSLHSVATLTSTVGTSGLGKSSTEHSSSQPSKASWCHTVLRSVGLALPLGLTFWISVHQGVLLLLIVLLVAVPMSFLYGSRSTFLVAGLALVLFMVLAGSLAWKHYEVSRNHNFRRDASTVQSLSAEVADYTVAYGRGILSNDPERRPWYLGLGLTKSAIALISLIVVVCRGNRWSVFLALVGIVSILFSLGANLRLGNFCLWNAFSAWVPGLAQVRSVYRFAFLAQIAFVLLGVDLLNRMFVKLEMASQTWRRNLSWLGCLSLLLAFALDPLPVRARLAVTPDANQQWELDLKNLDTGPVLILPIAFEGTVRDYEWTVQWMNQVLASGNPLVNGYSGFFPESFNRTAELLSVQGLTAETEEQLKKAGVRYVVVQPFYITKASEDWSRYRLVSDSQAAVRIYDLWPSTSESE